MARIHKLIPRTGLCTTLRFSQKLKNRWLLTEVQPKYREIWVVSTTPNEECNGLVIAKVSGKSAMLKVIDLSPVFGIAVRWMFMSIISVIGLHGNVLSWFETYLHNREFHDFIGEEKSSLAEMKTGIPQGPFLGLFFFLIYTTESYYLHEGYGSSCQLFSRPYSN